MAFRLDQFISFAVFAAVVSFTTAAPAVDLDPKAIAIKLPDQIEWKDNGGNRTATCRAHGPAW